MHFLEMGEMDVGQANIFDIWQAWVRDNDYVYKQEQLFPCQLPSPWWERHGSIASSAHRAGAFCSELQTLTLVPALQSCSYETLTDRACPYQNVDDICWATWRGALHASEHELDHQRRETSGNSCWSVNKKVNVLCPGSIALSGIAFSCGPREDSNPPFHLHK